MRLFVLLVALLVSPEAVAYNPFWAHGAYGNRVMSYYGGYGNRVMARAGGLSRPGRVSYAGRYRAERSRRTARNRAKYAHLRKREYGR
jgi:hypothetical protein